MEQQQTITAPESESERIRGLWVEYHHATARVIEIMQRQGTEGAAVAQIIHADASAGRAIRIIKEILGTG